MKTYYFYTGSREFFNLDELELNAMIRNHLLDGYNVLDSDTDSFICDTIDDAPMAYFGEEN